MDPGPLRDALTVAAGVGTGALSALFGVGGAVVSTPAIRALGASALTAVGTTLPSILPGATAGALRYAKEGLVERDIAGAAMLTGAPAAVGGSLLSEHVPGEGHVLMLITAALLGMTAWRLRNPPSAAAVEESERRTPQHRRGIAAAIGVVAGGMSGLLGVGGGIVMVPAFTQFLGLGIKRAVATSLVCVGFFAIPGTITHAALGNIDWRFASFLTIGVIPGARFGSAFALRVSEARHRLIVAVMLGAISLGYGIGEILAL